MAFTLQDDTGTVVNANAYIDVAYFRAYWLDKGTDTAALVDATVEVLIVSATQYIDTRYKYAGLKVNGRTQTTAFPRLYLCDAEGEDVEGIPVEVKQACCEYAYGANADPLSNTFTASEQSITKEFDKVDVLETEVEYNGSKADAYTWNIYQIGDTILRNSGFVIKSSGPNRA